jgi:3-hydroxymyristoyl/3-hydroxydecanoyl-(acyl carrier protein) dehydratase
MDEHFRAFSFVDQILAIESESGVRIRGIYTIPSTVTSFPASLVAEAIGQLAAWGAMATLDFQLRPVAGLAGSIDLLSTSHPGQVLELTAELDTVDNEAVAYAGTAHVGSVPVIRLQHCVGPMMPLEEFDDPQALRDRFALIQEAGAAPGAFGGVPSSTFDHLGGEPGQSLRATLHVPTSALFFADHFPRRPVFPGTLLMNANLELAATFAAQLPAPASGGRWRACGVSDVKLRAFTPPGETLEVEARLTQLSTDAATMKVETRKGKRVISGARVVFAPEERS